MMIIVRFFTIISLILFIPGLLPTIYAKGCNLDDNIFTYKTKDCNKECSDYLDPFISSPYNNSNSNECIDDLAITTDNRIKTYIHNPNEVYLLVLHFGFQSSIEFSKNEEVENIILGESYAWKITPLGNRLFIKPLEKNMRTNMTIMTNKRTYQFDIVSKELEEGHEKDLVYVVRFYYPKKRFNNYRYSECYE